MFSGRSVSQFLARYIAAAALGAVALGAQVPGEVRGHVLDARTARPVGDARVEIEGSPDRAETAADGAFVIRGLEPREYRLRVRAIGYAAGERLFEISNGRSTTFDVALQPVPVALDPLVVHADRLPTDESATVFDRAAIERSGRRDVGELVASAPGVVVTRIGGSGAASRISIRGSGANEVLVLVDGVPVNSEISGEADLSRIDLERVDHVTVLTGARSDRYGGRALAGVVDIRTRRPVRDASALLRTGAWGERSASASVGDNGPLGSMRAGGSLTTTYRTTTGDFPYAVPTVRGGGTGRRTNSDATSRDVLGTASLDADQTAVTVRGAWESLSRGLAGSIVQPSATGREQQDRQTGGVDAQWHAGARSWNVSGDVTHEAAHFADPAPPFGTAYDDTVAATAMRVASTFAIQGPVLSVSAGAEERLLDVTSTTLAATAPHQQRFTGAWANARGTRFLTPFGTQLDAELGGRVDETSLIGGAVGSPRAVLSLSRGVVAASGSIASGYAPPSLADQFFHEGVLVRANPSLRPERTRGDLEARLSLGETEVGPARLSASAATFRADIDGMILWLPDFRFIWSPSNYLVHRAGWELSGRAASIGGLLEVHGTLNATDATYSGGVMDGQVAYRPRTTANVAAAVAPGRARIELTTQYVGERRTVPGSSLNTLAPYWLSAARLSSPVDAGAWSADAAFGIENLFDRAAAMLVDYPFPPRTWTLSLRIRRRNARITR